jgi:pimeloyl-ACP methyl ester carboxylesterase
VAKTLKAGLKALAALALLVIATLAIVGALQPAVPSLPPDVVGTRALIAGVPLRYAQVGHGPDVLLIHGSPGSLEDWSPIVERLADRFRLTVYDRPGHGYSGGADLAHTPEENARMALEVIRALALENVVVVGHSYGGMTALALATRNPREVRAFVVVGSRGHGPVSVAPLYRLLAVPMVGAGIAATVGPWMGPAQIEAGIRSAFGPNVDAIPPGFVAERVRMWNRPTVSAVLSQERVTLGAALDRQALHYREIRKPVFLVYGQQDDRNYADAQRLEREIPGSRLVSLPNTGHYVQFARPDELCRVIEEAATARSAP